MRSPILNQIRQNISDRRSCRVCYLTHQIDIIHRNHPVFWIFIDYIAFYVTEDKWRSHFFMGC
jgi:hypothetical protein